MLNFTQPHEIFRLTVTSAIKLLKEDHLHASNTWQTIVDDVVHQLDLNKDKLYLYKDDLENLTALLLLRTTTRLGYIKQPDFYKPARKILQRIRDLGLSRALVDGINEFLLTPETWFRANQEQDRELLTYQLQAFEAILQKEKSKFCQNFQVDLPPTLTLPASKDLEGLPPSETRTEINQITGKEEINLDLMKIEKGYSLCILDIQGDFLLVDKAAENIFEKNQEELLRTNIFELMVPFSVCYLQKKFQTLPFDGQKRTFSYTIYSKSALKRLKTTLDSLEKKDQTEKRRKKTTNKPNDLEESVTFDSENSVYYKYLQALTSDATLVSLKLQNDQEFRAFVDAAKVKVREDHPIFKSSELENNNSPVILLITRKARHIQKFKYSIMQEHDQKISNMEIKSKRTLSKMQQKLFQKNVNFGNRHNLSN